MARGFESKSVQEQWQDAEFVQEQRKKKMLGPDEIDRAKKREELMLSRTRIDRELRETGSEQRRKSLSAALRFLDDELRKV